jgi:outer membrane immunogenic protein
MRAGILFRTAILASLVAGTPALGADLVLKAPPPSGAVDPWTGFYGGPHAGYGWGQKTFIDNFPTPDGEFDGAASVKGFVGGLQGGYNKQFNWLVLGIEGDFTWSGVKGTFNCFPFGDQMCSAQPEWFASVAGRAGIAYGPALFYVKGGIAWVHDEFTDLATCAGAQPRSRAGITAACGDMFFGQDTRPGWLFGLGVEYMFATNWSAKLEYNYMDFGGRSVPFSDGANGFFTEEIHQTLNVIKLGVNYHFEAGPGTWSKKPAALTASSDADEDEGKVTAFSVFDVSKFSVAGAAGALIAPHQDLDTSGIRFYVVGEAGAYKYPAAGTFIRGNYQSGEALAGYAFEGDFYSINLLAGLNAINHTLSAIDVDNAVQGTAFGVKVRADAWVNPTPKILTYGEAEYSTAFQTFSLKTKFGYDVTTDKGLFVGPEFGFSGDERFNQFRAGAHVTQIKFGKVSLDVSAGYARDSIVGDGAYGTVELSTKF